MGDLEAQIASLKKNREDTVALKKKYEETLSHLNAINQNVPTILSNMQSSSSFMKEGYSDSSFDEGYLAGDKYKIIIEELDTVMDKLPNILTNMQAKIDELAGTIANYDSQISAKQELYNEMSQY